MGLARGLARQLAAPSGIAGALCGLAMDFANRKPLERAVDLLRPASGEMVLDAGCGTGAASEAMLRRARCRIVAVDQSETMIRRTRSRLARTGYGSAVEVHQARLEDLPCQPGGIDAVLALNILYFCDGDGRMVSMLRRILRPGGRLVAYVTDRHSMEKWAFTAAGLHRLYDARQLRDVLVDGGFDPASIAIQSRSIAPGVQGLFALAHAD
nr:class I SAM-dependent methyltransferase [Sphingomonas sp. Y57]